MSWTTAAMTVRDQTIDASLLFSRPARFKPALTDDDGSVQVSDTRYSVTGRLPSLLEHRRRIQRHPLAAPRLASEIQAFCVPERSRQVGENSEGGGRVSRLLRLGPPGFRKPLSQPLKLIHKARQSHQQRAGEAG